MSDVTKEVLKVLDVIEEGLKYEASTEETFIKIAEIEKTKQYINILNGDNYAVDENNLDG